MKKKQKELIEALTKLWEMYPEQRLGQLLFNYTRFGTRGQIGFIRDIFHYQDEYITEDLKKTYEERS